MKACCATRGFAARIRRRTILRYLFIHQNFPGQFRHVARVLADDPANEVVAIGERRNLQGRPPLHPRIRLLAYQPQGETQPQTHLYLREYDSHVRRGQGLVGALMHLREQLAFHPDLVVAHPGWGEGLFLRDVYPRARQVQYCEYYYHGSGGDVGFDPEFPATLDDRLRVRIKNSTQLQSIVAADAGLSPTQWQKNRYPPELRAKIEVIHEGVDTQVVQPDPAAWVQIDGQRFTAGDEVVTYVARNLEPYRGFHVFMRALPELQALRPRARFIVVGGDDVSYGKRLPEQRTYRQMYREELGDRVDWSRVHFLGKLAYGDYLKVLQVSAAHVYLTYPFVLSWSMLEAMAAGCLLVASRTAPVEEVIEHGRNGLLVDFFDPSALARAVADALARRDDHAPLRAQARQTVVERYDLKSICLPRTLDYLHQR
jgi:glycosyltransferase involved in cell wall biosynthesis